MNPLESAELSDGLFERFRDLIMRESGITLGEHKRPLLQMRLGRRLRALRLADFEAYYRHLRDQADEGELQALLDEVSTNVTSFFREREHFEFLQRTALPALLARHDSYLHAWSAACSSGEEPYSLAISLSDHLPQPPDRVVRLLATDLSRRMLEKAQRGVYRREQLRTLSPLQLERYFSRTDGHEADEWEVGTALKRLIAFRLMNLNAPWPAFQRRFDLIFCRNVMIYFDRATQQELIRRFATVMKPGGYLFVGHAESLTGIEHDFEFARATIYRKPESAA